MDGSGETCIQRPNLREAELPAEWERELCLLPVDGRGGKGRLA